MRDIQRLLADSPKYREVGVCTLHSIGFQALKAARSLGYFDYQQATDVDLEEVPNVLFFRTLKQARSLGVSFAKELNDVDKDDFLDYVSTCKGNLRYPDLEKAGLPEAAMGVASQAPQTETIPWYLDLYRLFEEVRLETGLLTFDDMLMSGWEMLFRHPRVLADVSGRYQSVMVDEFQDVNLAQSEILDLITTAHRNYMVIGDEDQTIFEWRGASPRFILDFAMRYGAKRYTISDNFRCHASQVALANRVISQNSVREPKLVQLTKGFGGNTFVIPGTPETQANHVTSEIRAEEGKGRKLADMVILVRKYAQTPMIEQALTREQIPYRIVGSQPFYKRPEVAALLNYLHLAVYDRKLRAAERLSSQEIRAFRDTRALSIQYTDTVLPTGGRRGRVQGGGPPRDPPLDDAQPQESGPQFNGNGANRQAGGHSGLARGHKARRACLRGPLDAGGAHWLPRAPALQQRFCGGGGEPARQRRSFPCLFQEQENCGRASGPHRGDRPTVPGRQRGRGARGLPQGDDDPPLQGAAMAGRLHTGLQRRHPAAEEV